MSPSSLLGAVIQELDTRAARPSTPPAAPSTLVELAALKVRSSPRMVEAVNAEPVDVPRAEADSTVLDTVYGEEELSISIPIPEPEQTPGPQVADVASVRKSRVKKGRSAWQLLALLFGIGAVIAFVAFSANRTAQPGRAAAAAAQPESPAPTPRYRDAVTTPGHGALEVTAAGAEAVFVDGVERARDTSARVTASLAAGRHDVRVGRRSVTVDVREGSAAAVAFAGD